jgi:hypothetical protein
VSNDIIIAKSRAGRRRAKQLYRGRYILQFLVYIQVLISPQAVTSTESSKYSRLFSGHHNVIGMLKVSSLQRRYRHKAAWTTKLHVLTIIKFLGLAVVMLSFIPSPIGTRPSNAILSATTHTAEAANSIQFPSHFEYSRVHTPSRWATSSGRSTPEVCSNFSAGAIFRFC